MGTLIKSCRKHMILCIKRGETHCFYFLVSDVLPVRDRECPDGLGGADVPFQKDYPNLIAFENEKEQLMKP